MKEWKILWGDVESVVMDGNTFIGFCHETDIGYCQKCGNIFKYGWNGCDPLSEDKTCPKCGAFDKVETDGDIESHINMLKMLRDCNITNDEQKRSIRKEISDLNAIRRKFDAFREEEDKKRFVDLDKNIRR